MITSKNVTRNVRSNDRSIEGALIRVSPCGEIATVLLRASGRLARVSAESLSTTKGRPVKLIKGLCRADVNELIESSDDFCRDAIEELFGRQTCDERDAKSTRYDNEVGFRADDARIGSELAQRSVWSVLDLANARGVLYYYSGTQLWDVACEYLSEQECIAATTRQQSEAESLIAGIVSGSLVN